MHIYVIAGASPADDGGTPGDAGAGDGGASPDGAAPDAAAGDGANGGGKLEGGCGCRSAAGGDARPLGLLLLALSALALLRRPPAPGSVGSPATGGRRSSR